jgi:predicted AAA+ superfamily ATPase
MRDPGFLEANLNAMLPKGGVVFIDEVQRAPNLLNTIQYLIDQRRGTKFALTGSSARKLRRGQANLLPGRIHSYELGPLVASEWGYQADTQKLLSLGALPGVATEQDPRDAKKTLKSYAQIYLSEEIKAEALTKNLEGFSRFLFRIAQDSTKFLDLAKISNAVAVPRQTSQRFFEILEDTLVVRRLDAFAKSEKRRLVQHPRFFLFDNGVLNAMLGNFQLSDDRKGFLFENLFFNQLATSLAASDFEFRLSSYRTSGGAEIDIILEMEGDVFAIEVKSGRFSKSALTGFASFEDYLGKRVKKFVVTIEPEHRIIDDIEVLGWQAFLKNLKI